MIETNNLSAIHTLPPTSNPCVGCLIVETYFQFMWEDVYTHTAATIVKIVNNATNVTRTSTVYGTEIDLPVTTEIGAVPVSGLVITTNIGAIDYTLYAFSFQINRRKNNLVAPEHIQAGTRELAESRALHIFPSLTGGAMYNACPQHAISRRHFSSNSMLPSITCIPPSLHQAAKEMHWALRRSLYPSWG